MIHDPLCGLSEPCDDEVPEHGYCSRQHGQFCIHCLTWCICDRLKQAEQRMRDVCQAAAYADLLALEDDMMEAFGNGDAARIVAGYRSAMPGFRQFDKVKP